MPHKEAGLRNQRNVLAAFLILALLLVYSPEAGAQTETSNWDALQALFAQIAVRLDSIIAATGAQNLVLEHRAVEVQSPERLLYTSLVQAFAHNSRNLFAPSDSSEEKKSEGFAVHCKIDALEISYRKLPKPGWFRRAPAQRTVKVAVDFDLRETQTRRIYFQGVLTAICSDTLKSNVSQLENSALPFTRGAWQKNENRAAWLEPALLTAATGAIVYAFYSLRSQ